MMRHQKLVFLFASMRALAVTLIVFGAAFLGQHPARGDAGDCAAPRLQDTAPPRANSASQEAIPFKLTDANNLSISAVINGKDKVELMLHTAIHSVSVTQAAAETTPSLKFDKVQDVKSWGGEQTARLSEGNTLQIGEHSWHDLIIGESEHSGPETDGKFGLNLFAGKVIEIDFDESQVKLHDSLPELSDSYVPCELTYDRGNMFIEATLVIGETRLKNKFMVHSGYSGTILLDDKFVADNQLGDRMRLLSESELKDSFGNVLKTKQVSLPELQLADAKFADVPIGFFAGSLGRQKVSVMGGGLLKRFNLVIDNANKRIYLKPNRLFNAEFTP